MKFIAVFSFFVLSTLVYSDPHMTIHHVEKTDPMPEHPEIVEVMKTHFEESPHKYANLSINVVDFKGLQYMGVFSLGTPAQNLTLVLDTGSDTPWTASTLCKKCHGTRRYSCSNSSTCRMEGGSQSIYYGRGMVKGYRASDVININDGHDTTQVEVDFLLGYHDEGYEGTEAMGIMGLGRSKEVFNFVDLGYEKGIFEDILWVFDIKYKFTDYEYDSRVSFGAIPSIYDQSLFKYYETTMDQRWVILLQKISIGGKTHSTSCKGALIDSGTSNLIIPAAAYKEFLNNFPNESLISLNPGYAVECEQYQSYPNISFSFGDDEVYTVQPQDYLIYMGDDDGISYCKVMAQPQRPEHKMMGFVLLGDPFMRSHVTVFNKRTGKLGLYRRHAESVVFSRNIIEAALDRFSTSTISSLSTLR